MTSVFMTALRLSISAGLIILAVILTRTVFRRAPRKMICLLWALAALRLILPFSVPSPLSLIPEPAKVESAVTASR